MAAEPPPGPEARPGLWAELVDNRQSYLKLVKEFDEDLATMRAARLGFLDSDDREALVRRWNAARSRCELRLVVENRLRNEYRSALHLVKLGLVANNLPAKGRAQDRTAQEASTARVALQERHAYEIRAEGYRMTRELDIESAAWGILVQEKGPTFGPDSVPWAVGGAVALLGTAAALFVALRRPATGG